MRIILQLVRFQCGANQSAVSSTFNVLSFCLHIVAELGGKVQTLAVGFLELPSNKTSRLVLLSDRPFVLTEQQTTPEVVREPRWAYLVEQQHQAVFQGQRTPEIRVGARSQQPQQRVEDGRVLQQRLLRLADEHLEQLEQRPLAVGVQAAAEVPLDQALQDVLRDHQLQDGAHGRPGGGAALRALGGPLLRQQTQHLVGVIPHRRQVVAGGRGLLLLQHPRELSQKGAAFQ